MSKKGSQTRLRAPPLVRPVAICQIRLLRLLRGKSLYHLACNVSLAPNAV
jgi:hypothetical protein